MLILVGFFVIKVRKLGPVAYELVSHLPFQSLQLNGDSINIWSLRDSVVGVGALEINKYLYCSRYFQMDHSSDGRPPKYISD